MSGPDQTRPARPATRARTRRLHDSRQPDRSLRATLDQIPRGHTLGDEAQRRLREALMTGEMRPGQQITVRGLAAALGISMTPAREAMNRLAAEGVLAEGPNRTILVPRLSASDYRELLTIRLALEPLAASRAVAHVTRTDIAHLEKLQADLRQAHSKGDYRTVLRCNERFHFFLYGKSQMRMLVPYLESLWLRIGPTLTFLHEDSSWNATWLGDANHRRILAALSSHDATGVAESLRKDLEDGGKRLLAFLEGAGADAPSR